MAHSTHSLLPFLMLAFGVASLAGPADALEIVDLEIDLLTGASYPSFVEFRSTGAITREDDPVDDVPGAYVVAATSFQAVFAADAAGQGSLANYMADARHFVTFTTSAGPDVYYDLVLYFEWRGALVYFDDGTGGARGSMGEAQVKVQRDGLVVDDGALGSPRLLTGDAAHAGSVQFSTGETGPSLSPGYGVFHDDRRFELLGLQGDHDFRLDLGVSLSVMSADCISTITTIPTLPPIVVPCTGGGDEIAVLLGLPGTQVGVVADNYPGIFDRYQPLDGVFVGIVATVVPEPSTWKLVGLGLFALAALARRGRDRA